MCQFCIFITILLKKNRSYYNDYIKMKIMNIKEKKLKNLTYIGKNKCYILCIMYYNNNIEKKTSD